MAKGVRYNRGHLDSVIAAAYRRQSNGPVYIFATALGYTLQDAPPPSVQCHYVIDSPSSAIRFVDSGIPKRQK